MHFTKAFFVSALALASLAGCSAAPESDIDLLDAANAGEIAQSQDNIVTFGKKPDLVFDGGKIVVNDGLNAQVITRGDSVKVRCNTTTLTVTYKEKNAGFAVAGAHLVRLAVAGNPPIAVAVPGLAVGAAIPGSMSLIPAMLPANALVNATLTLDSSLVVAESNEGNNTFPFKLYRSCP